MSGNFLWLSSLVSMVTSESDSWELYAWQHRQHMLTTTLSVCIAAERGTIYGIMWGGGGAIVQHSLKTVTNDNVRFWAWREREGEPQANFRRRAYLARSRILTLRGCGTMVISLVTVTMANVAFGFGIRYLWCCCIEKGAKNRREIKRHKFFWKHSLRCFGLDGYFGIEMPTRK